MRFGDYLKALQMPVDVSAVERYQHKLSVDSLKSAVGNDSARYAELLARAIPTMRNAPPAQGPSPIVVYSLGQDDYLEENTVLATYLASNGYIFVTVPQLGTNERRMELLIDDQNSYEAQVRDLQTAVAAVPEQIHPDRTRVAAVGMSMGGIYALLVAMQNPGIRAVVGLDASYMGKRRSYEFDQKTLSYYDPLSLHAPLLSIYRVDALNSGDDVEALQASDRFLYRVDKAIHADFNSYPWYTYDIPPNLIPNGANDLQVRSQEQGLRNLNKIDALVLNFLDATVRDGRAFGPPVVPGASLTVLQARDAPTEEKLAQIVMSRGYESAATSLQAAMTRYPGQQLVRFANLNRIGFEFIYTDRAAMAVSIFRLNVLAYPKSSDAYESLGEGYAALDEKSMAIDAFRTALRLNPNNVDAAKELARLTSHL